MHMVYIFACMLLKLQCLVNSVGLFRKHARGYMACFSQVAPEL